MSNDEKKGLGDLAGSKKPENKSSRIVFDVGPQHTRNKIETEKVRGTSSGLSDLDIAKSKKNDDPIVGRTIRIKESYFDLIKDAVYSRKYLKGQVGVTQQTIIEEALDFYKQNHEITKLPEELRDSRI